MIRVHRVSAEELKSVMMSTDLRAGEKSVLTADIGLLLAVLLHDAEMRAGGFVLIRGAVQEFNTNAEAQITALVKKLVAMGANQSRLECLIMGGTIRSNWQLDRTTRLLRDMGFSVKTGDVLGEDIKRKISFDLNSGVVNFCGRQEDPSRWDPSKGNLAAHEGSAVFGGGGGITGVVANATRFFREKNTFKGLRELVFPEFLARTNGLPFTMWCAASSSGQEPYSYAMYLLRLRQRTGATFPIRVLATDINEDCLKEGQRGKYSISEQDAREYGAYFRAYGSLEGETFQAGRELSHTVRFKKYDIARPVAHSRFHLIVCANVFQYYSPEARLHFLQNFIAACHRPGYIFIGPPDRSALRQLGLEYFPKYGLLRVDG